MADPGNATPRLVEGRSCEGCTMCCKLPKIDALNKPAGVLCQHCENAKGCQIYADRPQVCRDFYCAYRHYADVGDEWRPADCGMLVNFDGAHNQINISVDTRASEHGGTRPITSRSKRGLRTRCGNAGHLVVREGLNMTVVLPNRDVDLGALGDRIVVVMGRRTPLGEEYDVLALAPDDPRLAQYKPTV